mgnify:CR=1 FL=1
MVIKRSNPVYLECRIRGFPQVDPDKFFFLRGSASDNFFSRGPDSVQTPTGSETLRMFLCFGLGSDNNLFQLNTKKGKLQALISSGHIRFLLEGLLQYFMRMIQSIFFSLKGRIRSTSIQIRNGGACYTYPTELIESCRAACGTKQNKNTIRIVSDLLFVSI